MHVAIAPSDKGDGGHGRIHPGSGRRTDHDEIQVSRRIGSLAVESRAGPARQDGRNAVRAQDPSHRSRDDAKTRTLR